MKTTAAILWEVNAPWSVEEIELDAPKAAGFGQFKISVVVTRHNVDQLDEFKALADSYGAQFSRRCPLALCSYLFRNEAENRCPI